MRLRPDREEKGREIERSKPETETEPEPTTHAVSIASECWDKKEILC